MLVWLRKVVNIRLIAFAVTVALVLTSFGFAISHHSTNEQATALHQNDTSIQLDAHGHSHDHDSDSNSDDSDNGVRKPAGHLAGHNAADHSHVTAGTPSADMSFWQVDERNWQGMPFVFADLKTDFKLDRPPKSAS